LSINDKDAPYCLHGFNAIYLPEIGWYRVDARGNKEGIDSQFIPPHEQLAYRVQLSEEVDFQPILADPLQLIVDALQAEVKWEIFLRSIPDISLGSAQDYGLVVDNEYVSPR
jgi:transglutaminase-like putative cysteine protease